MIALGGKSASMSNRSCTLLSCPSFNFKSNKYFHQLLLRARLGTSIPCMKVQILNNTRSAAMLSL